MSGFDDVAAATGAAPLGAGGPASTPTAERAEALPVAPVLVQDYRRLVRLFPYTYRRAHEAEMLGHLLDGAQPGQSRPTRAERWDLLRAASREWLLAPLGSLPAQRRAATGVLFTLLPAVLVLMAARVVAFTLALVPVLLRPDDRPPLFPTLSTAPMWAIWLVSVVVTLMGWRRGGLVLGLVAAATGVLTLGALVVTGYEYAVYLEAPWVVGLVAYAGVLAGRSTCRVGRESRRLRGATLGAMVLALGAYVAAAYSDSLHLGVPWWSRVALNSWTLPALAVPVLALLGAAVLWDRSRQAVPVLAGLAVALLLSRSAFFWSGSVDVQTADLGNVLGLVAFAGGAAVAARWVVNRLDELSEARASHRALLTAAGGLPAQAKPVPTPARPGDPTAV